MLKINIELFVHSPPPKKLIMAHLSSSVDRDRLPCQWVATYIAVNWVLNYSFLDPKTGPKAPPTVAEQE